MTYKGAEYSFQDLFEELMSIVLREKIESFDQYKDLIDSLLEEKRTSGFFSDDEDLSQLKEDLELRWNELERRLSRKAEEIIP